MGYSIQYDPSLNKKYRKGRKWKPDRKWLIAGCVMGALTVVSMVTPLRRWLVEFLIPGDAQVTGAAFSEFVSNVRSGEKLTDAVTVFCREILANA